MKDANFSYKSKVFAGILSRKAFVGPYFVAVGDRYRCNYRCIFCEWFSPLVKKVRNEVLSPGCMSMEDYRKVVRELGALGTKVILIGNIEEPFMDTQLLEKIEYAKQHNLGCFLLTNVL